MDGGFPPPAGTSWSGVLGCDADTVELKITLGSAADPAPALTGRARPRRRVRRMYLLDTADVAFARTGVELRLRRRGSGRHDLAVRRRQRGRLHERLRPPGARVELDVVPGDAVRTTELLRPLAATLAGQCLTGAVPPSRLLSPAQGAWLRATTTDGGRRLDALVVHGPLTVERVRIPPERFPHGRARLERCAYPSGREIVEFSARCLPGDAPRVAAEAAAFLAGHGIAPAPTHRTKTAVWIDEITRLLR